MKKSLLKTVLASLAIFFAISFAASAKIVIVDNYKFVGQYKSLDDAVGYSSAGDTIYLTGSPNLYVIQNNYNMSNRTIIGVGYNPQTPSAYSSTIVANNMVTRYSSNFTFEGIKFVCMDYQYCLWQAIDHVKFNRCCFSGGKQFFSYAGVQSNNLEFTNCIFDNCILSGGNRDGGYYFTFNSIISNNIFWYSEITNFSGSQIYNNVFIGENNSSTLSYINGSQIYNNIFYGTSTSDFSNITTCDFKSNLKPGSVDLPPSGDGNSAENNQNLGTGTSDFTNIVTSSTSWSTANDFHLTTGSAGKKAGNDVHDMGIFGGQFHFPEFADGTTDYTGEPAELPVFRAFNILNDGDMFPTVGTGGQVQFQVRAIKK